MGSKARPHAVAQRWFQRGVRAAESGDFAGAERAYRSAIAAAADFGQAHINLGTALQMQGRLGEAQAAYQTAVALDPSNGNAYANLGSVCCALGNVVQAEALYRRAVELDAQAAHNHAGLGAVLHARSQHAEAAASLRRAIELMPMWAEPRRVLGLSLFAAGDHLAAVDACLTTLALDERDAVARSVLGLALAELGQLVAAAVELARVVELDPTCSAAHFNLGIVCDRLDRDEAAADSFRAARDYDPSSVRAQLNFASSMMRLGRRDEAAMAYRAVLAIDPQEPTARHLVAALTSQTTETAPAGYVRALFDHNAADFDSHLRGLDYTAPATIGRVVKCVCATPLSRVLDIGCGTGMVGAELREFTEELCGVDLSSGMIAEAKRHNHYDHLHVCDAVEYLRAATDQFDAAVAGDVLIYMGDLAPLLAALRPRLRDGGMFVFSVETGQGTWQLMPTGRYAHGSAYVESVAHGNGFQLVSRDVIMLRYEHGAPVDGNVFVFRALPTNPRR